MAADPASSTLCPVIFCGAPTLSKGFDAFSDSAQKAPTIGAKQIYSLKDFPEKTKDLDHGVLVILLSNKNDLVLVLNNLVTLKKRIDQGVVRVMVYSLMDHAKIPQLLKAKGCTETILDGVSQKALGHKIQKHIQIVNTKFDKHKSDQVDEVALKAGARKAAAARAPAIKGKLSVIPAIENENDCWLVKNKKDFRFIRGMWMGEMIGPGPSIGSWDEVVEGTDKKQAIFQWVPRSQPDPFVPGSGKWYFSGKKPEFVWKTNRWLFIGEAPSLFYQATDAAGAMVKAYRLRSGAAGLLELALNSKSAKAKLKAIMKTFSDEKTFSNEKKKPAEGGDVSVDQDKKKSGEWGDKLTPDKEAADWNDNTESEEEESAEWGDLEEGEEEAEPDWNDDLGGEEEEPDEWGGLDTGRGNKFNSGRGMGQGQGGAKGYKYEDEEFAKEAAENGWQQGADAFNSIELKITMCRVDSPGAPVLDGLSILERSGSELFLDVPTSNYVPGEKISFSVILGADGSQGKKKNLELNGTIKGSEHQDGGSERDILEVSIAELSHGHLAEIQSVFDLKQEQLLRFLREAKGG